MSDWIRRLRRRRDVDSASQGPLDPMAPATLAYGWNGLPWGSALAEFRNRFPHADLTSGGWWVTGEGPEEFCGITMAYTQYGFNRRQELYLVSFIPETQDRASLAPAALNMFGAPSGMGTVWNVGQLVVEVKVAGVLATLTHERFGRHA